MATLNEIGGPLDPDPEREPLPPGLPASDDNSSLLDYWAVLRRRRWVLAAASVLIFLATVVWTLRQSPAFRATTTLLVEPNSPELAGLSADTPAALVRQFYQTQYEIIRSDTVIRRLFESEPELARLPELQLSEAPTDLMRSLITVQPVTDSHLVKVSVDYGDRDIALQLADALAKAYIDHSNRDRRSTSNNTFEWLSVQIDDMRVKVEQAERALLEYRDQEDVVSVERQQLLLEEKMASVSRELNEVTTRTLELATTLAEVDKLKDSPAMVESLPRTLDNEHVRRLKDDYSSLSLQLAKLAQKYKPKHPDIVSLRSQIAIVEERLAAEAKKIFESVQIEHRISTAKERSLKASLESIKQESMTIADQAIRYRMLKREAESNRNIYDVLLQRLREADIGGHVSGENIRVLDKATAAISPYKPRVKLNLVIGLLAGLMIGVAASFLAEHVDSSIKSEQDVAQVLREPLLGTVPWRKGVSFKSAPDGVIRAYDELKTRLRVLGQAQPLRTILVTSAVNTEGKTISAFYLASSFARAGVRTLLIDGDMFRSNLSERLGATDGQGLADYFVSGIGLEGLIRQVRSEPNLHFVRAGVITNGNPGEPLGSARMSELIAKTKATYGVVVIDSPPVTAALDVAFLAAMVDGVVMVARANKTSRQVIHKVLSHLRSARGRVLGVLLTGAEVGHESAGASYHYGYYRSPRPTNGDPPARPTPVR